MTRVKQRKRRRWRQHQCAPFVVGFFRPPCFDGERGARALHPEVPQRQSIRSVYTRAPLARGEQRQQYQQNRTILRYTHARTQRDGERQTNRDERKNVKVEDNEKQQRHTVSVCVGGGGVARLGERNREREQKKSMPETQTAGI